MNSLLYDKLTWKKLITMRGHMYHTISFILSLLFLQAKVQYVHFYFIYKIL